MVRVVTAFRWMELRTIGIDVTITKEDKEGGQSEDNVGKLDRQEDKRR
jgi:hypothetical protein